MESADPLELLAEVGSLLDALSIDYCVGGSWASGYYGEPRTTLDLDLIVQIGDADIDRFAAALGERYYVNRDAMREAVATRRAFNAIDTERGLKVDFFVRGDSEFDRVEFARRRFESLGPAGSFRVPIKSPEDSVLRKLQWYRDGGEASDRQWRDVLGVLGVNEGALDDVYLDRWAAELRIADLLVRARAEAAR